MTSRRDGMALEVSEDSAIVSVEAADLFGTDVELFETDLRGFFLVDFDFAGATATSPEDFAFLTGRTVVSGISRSATTS